MIPQRWHVSNEKHGQHQLLNIPTSARFTSSESMRDGHSWSCRCCTAKPCENCWRPGNTSLLKLTQLPNPETRPSHLFKYWTWAFKLRTAWRRRIGKGSFI